MIDVEPSPKPNGASNGAKPPHVRKRRGGTASYPERRRAAREAAARQALGLESLNLSEAKLATYARVPTLRQRALDDDRSREADRARG